MKRKISTLSFRINFKLKSALVCAAKKERRSITNMIEFLIYEYCEKNGIYEDKKEDE